MRDEALGERFAALSAQLAATRGLWTPRPFIERVLPWEADYPALSAWLRGLDEAAVQRLEADGFAAEGAPEPYGSLARACRELSRVPALSAAPLATGGSRKGVPARKLAQVERLAAVARPRVGGARGILDWCSGKGHLGRSLSLSTGLPLRLLERDPALARAGESRAREEGVACEACVGDALDPASWGLLRAGEAAVALHACGALTDTLLRESTRRGVGVVVVAPCCYHRYQAQAVGAISGQGRSVGLDLPVDIGRMVTAEVVVARPLHQVLRRQEMAWRLGLDAAIAARTGEDRYTTLPSVSRPVVQLPFAEFCAYFAASHGLELPEDLGPFEARGWALARQARALSLVRGLFRRPLELWLVLDRALSLQEAGWSVELGTFCEAALTPRNLVLAAAR